MNGRAEQYLLNHDDVFHMDMIEAIRRNHAEMVAANDRGVLLRETGSGAFFLTAEDEAGARALLDEMPAKQAAPSEPLFVAHQDFALPELEKRYSVKPQMHCYQAAWKGPGRVIVPEMPYAFAPLGIEAAPVVVENYSHPTLDEAYIQGRLAAGEMFGAFTKAGELIGFIGLHEEGSMGMLEVDPAYRRKGVGAALVAYLANLQLQKGHTPFSQFIPTNEASRSLNQRLGFAISDQMLCWMY